MYLPWTERVPAEMLEWLTDNPERCCQICFEPLREHWDNEGRWIDCGKGD
jgi:hypothetical protein